MLSASERCRCGDESRAQSDSSDGQARTSERCWLRGAAEQSGTTARIGPETVSRPASQYNPRYSLASETEYAIVERVRSPGPRALLDHHGLIAVGFLREPDR